MNDTGPAMMTFKITLSTYAEYGALLLDPESDTVAELSDLLRFDLAWIDCVEWQRDASALVIGAEEVQP